MGRFGFGIIAIMAFIALLTGLCELLFHRALKMHPAMRDLLAKMAQARRRDFSFCQPLPTTAQTSASRRSLYASPAGTLCRPDGKISNIIFKKWFAGNPTREYHGVGIQCDTAPLAFFWQNGFANFGLHPFFTAVNRPFSLSAIG